MIFTSRYIESSQCLIYVHSDKLNCQDVIDTLHDALQYVEQGKHIAGVIADYSSVTEFNVNADDVMKITDATMSISKHLPLICVAIVAPNPSIFGTIRMWQVFSQDSGWISEVLHSHKDAASWLCGKLGIKSIND